MEVAKLTFTATDAFPSTCENQLALSTARIDDVVHVIVTAHEGLLFTEIKVTNPRH